MGDKDIERKRVGDVEWVHGKVESAQSKMGVNVFVTDGLMIDTGSESLLSDLIPFFQSVDFDQVVLTHYHEDHTGGCAWIQKHKQVPLFIHSMSLDVCSKQGEYPDYRKRIWGVREGFQARPIGETIQSHHHTWKAIFTPGHARDHMSYLNQSNGVLFSGDLFVTPKTKVILQEESIPTIIHSIKKVLRYDFQEVFCCHAGYLPNGRELFQVKLDYLENLQGEIIRLHQQGLTVEEIQQKVFPKQYPIIEYSDYEWDSKHIITSILRKAQFTSVR
ncbi:MBL fold metallo-hydrolase [Peribacillus sp. Hz7]|uniref:MBL fold metallo-hydrolase n=1 Tax=Peribacillus sp. Hz7 TaxID=3344873 RepID=UPI0035CAF621